MTKPLLLLSAFLTLLAVLSCGPKENNASVPTTPIEKRQAESPKENENTRSGRAAWQKPDFVISKLGNLQGKTVADIGAGMGYFTFRLAFKADHVIGVDIDEDMINTLDQLKSNLPEVIQEKVEARLATADDPKLKEGEVDCMIIINTIAYIENRVAYLSNLKKALKEDGMIMILDFKMKNLPEDVAPPRSERAHLFQLELDLEAAGYQTVISDDTSLEYQYFIFAYK